MIYRQSSPCFSWSTSCAGHSAGVWVWNRRAPCHRCPETGRPVLAKRPTTPPPPPCSENRTCVFYYTYSERSRFSARLKIKKKSSKRKRKKKIITRIGDGMADGPDVRIISRKRFSRESKEPTPWHILKDRRKYNNLGSSWNGPLKNT